MPAEALDPEAVKAASKIMQATKAEMERRQEFETALSEAAQAGSHAQITRQELAKRVATDTEMMTAASAHRQAEQNVSVALGKLLDAAVHTHFLQITTPGEFAFGFDPQPSDEESLAFMIRTGRGEQDDT